MPERRNIYRVIEWPQKGDCQWLVQVNKNLDGSDCYFPMLQLEQREDGRTAEEIIKDGLDPKLS